MTSNAATPATAAGRAGADGMVDIAVASCISSQLQCRKPDEHQHHRDDPEANWVVLATAAMLRKRNMA
jgi:hypothetical protein